MFTKPLDVDLQRVGLLCICNLSIEDKYRKLLLKIGGINAVVKLQEKSHHSLDP